MANRDLTEKQFEAALKRNGFSPTPLGMWFKDKTGVAPNVHFGGVLRIGGKGGLNRRATLAHILRERDRHAARQPA